MSHLQNLPELDPILTDPDFLFPTGPAFLNQFATLDAIPEEEAQWLIPGWLPQGQLALLAADGGTGKTGFWCQLLAALSRGESTLLDTEKTTRPPLTAAFFSAEDSVRKKLKKRLRLCGARMVNLVTLDLSSPALWDLRLGSKELAQFIGAYRPALCVLDPIQGFLPDGVNMASRNEIRACLAPLISLGEEYGTAFLLVCHTNKRAGAWGRTRLADSADLWDAARSVWMMGDAGDGRRYLSQEKNNYGPLQPTRLYTFSDTGMLLPAGVTHKRDREFQLETQPRQAPKREGCKEAILEVLQRESKPIPVALLDQQLQEEGYSRRILQSVKEELKSAGLIKYQRQGGRKDGRWEVSFTTLPT